jgi:hypothetical protein
MATKTEQSIIDREKRTRANVKTRRAEKREAAAEAKAQAKAMAEKAKKA